MDSSEGFNTSVKFGWTICISVSVFFYLFLVFFLPFGVSNYNPNHQYTLTFFIEIFYFFLALFAGLLFNEFFIKTVINPRPEWGHLIAWTLWSFVFLGVVLFHVYNLLGDWHDYNIESALSFVVNCSSVFVFPWVGVHSYYHYRSLETRYESILTNQIDRIDLNELIRFSGQGANDQITLTLNSFIYGRAQDNYVELYYVEKEELSKILIRASMAGLVESIHNKAVARCHRSYLVNIMKVKAVKGSMSNLKLVLEPNAVSVPISRAFRDPILSLLRELRSFG